MRENLLCDANVAKSLFRVESVGEIIACHIRNEAIDTECAFVQDKKEKWKMDLQ